MKTVTLRDTEDSRRLVTFLCSADIRKEINTQIDTLLSEREAALRSGDMDRFDYLSGNIASLRAFRRQVYVWAQGGLENG